MTGKTSITIGLNDEDLERLKTGWVPCTRIRLVGTEGNGRLEIDTRATCTACKGVGVWRSENLKASCKYCGGTGQR